MQFSRGQYFGLILLNMDNSKLNFSFVLHLFDIIFSQLFTEIVYLLMIKKSSEMIFRKYFKYDLKDDNKMEFYSMSSDMERCV